MNAEIILLNDSILTQYDDSFVINGKINNLKYDFNNIILPVYENGTGNEKNCSCITTNKEANNYKIECNTKESFIGSVNNTLGLIQDSNGKYLLISIKSGNNDLLKLGNKNKNGNENENGNETQDFTINRYYNNKKSSGGLSTGAIIAIIIPCILALIIFLSVLIMMNRGKFVKKHEHTPSNASSQSGVSLNIIK